MIGRRPVYLVKAADPTLRRRALDELLDELLGADDRSLALEEVTVPARGEAAARAESPDDDAAGGDARARAVDTIVNALASPPFTTSCRVVVAHGAEHLAAPDAAPLAAALADPLPTSVLVLVAAGGRLAPSLAKAAKGPGADRSPHTPETSGALAAEAAAVGIALTPRALALASAHLGEDADRAPQLAAVLRAAFGDGARLDAGEVEPYLGAAGSVPAYRLTNAIEQGDVPAALEVLDRMLTASSAGQTRPMHPLQVLSLLHHHYRRLMRLDDPRLRGVDDAVAALGGRVKAYPARKALEQARRLGSPGLRRGIGFLHEADGALKGGSGMPERTVLEVLVVRLATLGRSGVERAAGGRARGAGDRSGAGARSPLHQP